MKPKGIIREKFQVDEPQDASDDAHGGWVSDVSARVKKGQPGREGRPGGDSTSRSMNNAAFFNSSPPGMDIEDQENIDSRQMPYGGSLGSGTQATNDVTRESLICGFSRKRMRNTDDMYTNEHQDSFYGDVEVDGVVGFLERNNTLDRS